MKESPIFTKTFDLLAWLLPMSLKFPREQRFVLAGRLQNAAFNFYEDITSAGLGHNTGRSLEQADVELQRLRLYLRLSHQLKLLSIGQYEHAARMIVEIGKLLGGWRKSSAKADT